VEKNGRVPAFVAYLLPIIAPLLLLLFNRKNLFVAYHACQSLAIVFSAVLLTVFWAVVAWATSWIPLFGAIFCISTFALVISTWVLALVAWFLGMSNVLQGSYRRVPIFGQWGEKAFLRLHAEEEAVAPQEGQEATV